MILRRGTGAVGAGGRRVLGVRRRVLASLLALLVSLSTVVSMLVVSPGGEDLVEGTCEQLGQALIVARLVL